MNKRDKTALDAFLLASVLEASKGHREKLSADTAKNFSTFDKAIEKKAAEGKVSGRLVRAAFSATESIVPQMAMDRVSNPFVSPHNLSWYFGNCVCPQEVRLFATRIGDSHIRVWSVAQDREYWRVVAQVFDASSAAEARQAAEQNSRVPAKSLKNHTVDEIGSYKVSGALDPSAIEYSKVLLDRAKQGHFVEVLLRKKGGY